MSIGTLTVSLTFDGYRHVEQESSLCKLCSRHGFESWNWKERQVTMAVIKVSWYNSD